MRDMARGAAVFGAEITAKRVALCRPLFRDYAVAAFVCARRAFSHDACDAGGRGSVARSGGVEEGFAVEVAGTAAAALARIESRDIDA